MIGRQNFPFYREGKAFVGKRKKVQESAGENGKGKGFFTVEEQFVCFGVNYRDTAFSCNIYRKNGVFSDFKHQIDVSCRHGERTVGLIGKELAGIFIE